MVSRTPACKIKLPLQSHPTRFCNHESLPDDFRSAEIFDIAVALIARQIACEIKPLAGLTA